MTTGILLRPVTGTTPLGFLTALGALDVASNAAIEPATLHWTEELVPRAVLRGARDLDELLDWAVADLENWRQSPVLTLPSTDIKPPSDVLHYWTGSMVTADRRHVSLFAALLAEGARAGTNAAKPTHLHFTAGQQQFLTMVRTLAQAVDRAALAEALVGPWRYESTLPTLGWDTRGERMYALRGTDPSTERRTGVPGADWLAFLGLAFLPVFAQEGRLVTTGCDASWKSGGLTWPLWRGPLTAPVARSLLGFAGLRDEPEQLRQARGVFRMLRAPISRSDQGGYGSFRAAQAVGPEPRPPIH